MAEQEGASAEEPKSADDRIAELEAKLSAVTRDYSASSREAKRLADHVQALQSAYEAPRQQIPQRASYEQELEQAAIPVNALDQYVGERIQRGIHDAFQPLMRGMSARSTMVGEYGEDYNKFEAKMMAYINSDPERQAAYQRTFQADPVVAFDWAFLKYGQSERQNHPTRNGGTRQDEVEAQIPTTRHGDTRRRGRGDESALAEAAQAYRQSPTPANAQAYAKVRLKQAISDDHLNS